MYLNKSVDEGYMEIFMYLNTICFIARDIGISMYLTLCVSARYKEITMYHVCFIARYMEISVYLALYVAAARYT